MDQAQFFSTNRILRKMPRHKKKQAEALAYLTPLHEEEAPEYKWVENMLEVWLEEDVSLEECLDDDFKVPWWRDEEIPEEAAPSASSGPEEVENSASHLSDAAPGSVVEMLSQEAALPPGMPGERDGPVAELVPRVIGRWARAAAGEDGTTLSMTSTMTTTISMTSVYTPSGGEAEKGADPLETQEAPAQLQEEKESRKAMDTKGLQSAMIAARIPVWEIRHKARLREKWSVLQAALEKACERNIGESRPMPKSRPISMRFCPSSASRPNPPPPNPFMVVRPPPPTLACPLHSPPESPEAGGDTPSVGSPREGPPSPSTLTPPPPPTWPPSTLTPPPPPPWPPSAPKCPECMKMHEVWVAGPDFLLPPVPRGLTPPPPSLEEKEVDGNGTNGDDINRKAEKAGEHLTREQAENFEKLFQQEKKRPDIEVTPKDRRAKDWIPRASTIGTMYTVGVCDEGGRPHNLVHKDSIAYPYAQVPGYGGLSRESLEADSSPKARGQERREPKPFVFSEESIRHIVATQDFYRSMQSPRITESGDAGDDLIGTYFEC